MEKPLLQQLVEKHYKTVEEKHKREKLEEEKTQRLIETREKEVDTAISNFIKDKLEMNNFVFPMYIDADSTNDFWVGAKMSYAELNAGMERLLKKEANERIAYHYSSKEEFGRLVID